MPASAALEAAVPVVPPPDTSGVPVVSMLDVVRVELGYGLLELASGGHQQLPEQIKRLRRALAAELGFVLPSVRIQDNVELEPNNYVFALKEIAAGRGELRPLMMLAISPGDDRRRTCRVSGRWSRHSVCRPAGSPQRWRIRLVWRTGPWSIPPPC